NILEEPVNPKVRAASALKHEFQELHVTCPDGLTIKYFLQGSAGVGPDSPDARHLLVRQSYPFKTSGVQSCESIRNKYIQSEVSRVITADGHVIKNMVDGSVEVLGSDGTISVFTGAWNYGMHESAADGQKRTSRAKRLHKSKPQHDSAEHSKTPAANWTITYPNGERLRMAKDTGNIVELPSLPVCVACDPETKQIMCTRDDQVIVITYPDGGTIVEHADGTRISTYYKDITVLDEGTTNSYIQTMKFIKVECPAFATVEFNTATSENLTVFGNGTNINVFPDGYYMFHHSKGGRIEIDTEGTMTYFPQRNHFQEQQDSGHDKQYVIRHNADIIVETIDPNGNVFNVRSNGETIVIPAVLEDLYSTKSRLKAELMPSHDNHAPRFFIVHDDCSGTELLRYEDVAEYLSITVLKPFLSGISEKWLKKYDQECIVPQGLRCRDLKTIPAKEYKKPGPVFGTNVGKGLNIGIDIKAPAKIPILKCPEKLELRHLLQFQPVTEDLRQKLLSALREFASEVLARMQTESLLSIEDPRSQEEKQISQELKVLAEAFKLGAKKYETQHLRSVYEQAVTPPPPCPPSKPIPKRAKPVLEQDRRENEDKEARMIIRKSIFEPYFESELGQVFFDEMARALDDGTQNKNMDSEANRSASRDPNDIRHNNSSVLFADIKRNDRQNLSLQHGYVNSRDTEKTQIQPPKYSAFSGKSEPVLADYLKKENHNLAKHDDRANDASAKKKEHLSPRPTKYNGPLEKSVPVFADYLKKQLEKLTELGEHGKEISKPQSNFQFTNPEQQKPVAVLEKKTQRQPFSSIDKAVLTKSMVPGKNKYSRKPTYVTNSAEKEAT
ncbi:unnamed protein product, partial [Candidula unifasciata]